MRYEAQFAETVFSVDRPHYRPHAAVDGWQKVLAWFGKHLS